MNWMINVSGLIKEVELRKNPIIIRVNKFDDEAAKKFHQEMAQAHNTGQPIIPVVIDSYGGEVYSLMSMISAMKSAELPVATIIEGKAMSCGAILFSFGEEGRRFMDPNGTLMIHDVSSGMLGKIEELKADVKEAERLNDVVYKMMAQNCGKADNYFTKLVGKKKHADWYLDAAEAKKHNLANHLRVPKLTIDIDVTIEME